MSSKRIPFYDNYRFFLITAVVVGHFLDAYRQSGIFKSLFVFIYIFHMPAFIFTAGMFHQNKNVRKRVIFFFVVGYLLKILITLTLVISGAEETSFSMLSDSNIPWYMFALSAYTILSYLTRDLDKRVLLVLSVLLGCFAGYDPKVGDYLYLSRIAVFYPFYIAGEIACRETIRELRSKKSVRVLSLVFLCSILLICLGFSEFVYSFRPLLTGRYPFKVSDAFLRWGCLYRLGCYCLSMLLSFSLLMLTPAQRIFFLTAAGSRTLHVYFWHYPILGVLRIAGLPNLLCASIPGKALWVLLAFLLTILLSLKPAAVPLTVLKRQLFQDPDRKTRPAGRKIPGQPGGKYLASRAEKPD